jgi:pimeloyl-ACP methyl ester carboxylesterase
MTLALSASVEPPGASGAGLRTVVLVHGYLGGSAQWSDLAAALSDRFRVVAVDLPGFGLASGEATPSSIAGFAERVIADLDARDIGRFALVGHSMGGMIVQEMARRIPDRIERLVLYGTGALGSMPDRFEPLEVSLERLRQDGLASTARRIAATWLMRGEAHPAFETLSDIGGRANRSAAEIALNAMAEWDGRAHLPLLEMPTLIVWGDRDRSYRWAQVEHLWTHLPDASLAVIPGASHAAHLEKPEIFRLLIEDFLSQ